MNATITVTQRILIGFLLCSITLVAQQDRFVEVSGDVKNPLKLTLTELGTLPRATVQTSNDGIIVNYEGVWLHELLSKAGVVSDTDLRGKALASYVLAEAEDGYHVVFSIAELNPAFTDTQVLLADKADGKPLSGEQGNFRLVAPKDKRGARSVRMLTRLQVVQLRK